MAMVRSQREFCLIDKHCDVCAMRYYCLLIGLESPDKAVINHLRRVD
jgi:hypothetical protein